MQRDWPSASLVYFRTSLEWFTSTLLIVCTPQSSYTPWQMGYLSQKGFYSWSPTYPPKQPDQYQEAVLEQGVYLLCPDHKYFSRPPLSFWRNNDEWIYAHSNVTSASAATLNQTTDFSLLLSQSQWLHSPGGREEHNVTLWNTYTPVH